VAEVTKVSEAVTTEGEFNLEVGLVQHLGFTKAGKFGRRAKWGFESQDGVLAIFYTPAGITPKELEITIVGLGLPKAKTVKAAKAAPAKTSSKSRKAAPKVENTEGEPTVTITEAKLQEMMVETAQAAAKAAVEALVS